MKSSCLILSAFAFVSLACSHVVSEEKSAIDPTVKRALDDLFSKEGTVSEDRLKALDDVAVQPNQVPAIVAYARRLTAKRGDPSEKNPHPFEFTSGEKYRTTYYLYPPTMKAEKYPLVLILHGGGGKGVDQTKHVLDEIRFLWPKMADKYVVAPVAIPSSATLHWCNPPNNALVVNLIGDLVSRYPIDTNRMYMVGGSMGGWASWAIGAVYADRFAAIASFSGGYTPSEKSGFPLINQYHVPVYVHHGGKDGPPYDHQRGPKFAVDMRKKWHEQYGEFETKTVVAEGQGHMQATKQQVNDALEWTFKFSRNPRPKKVIWKVDQWSLKTFYWLRIDAPRAGDQIVATIEGNTIEIESSKLRQPLTINLDDKLVDLAKPITVRFNGTEKFHGSAKPGLRTVISSLLASNDPESVYCASIVIDIN